MPLLLAAILGGILILVPVLSEPDGGVFFNAFLFVVGAGLLVWCLLSLISEAEKQRSAGEGWPP